MRVDVIGNHEVCLTMLGAHDCSQWLVQEGRCRRHTSLASGGTDIHRRLDAQARYARSDHVLEQVTVIAGDFDHERFGAESKPSRGVVHEPLRVLYPAVGVGREVGVVRESIFRGDQCRDLE